MAGTVHTVSDTTLIEKIRNDAAEAAKELVSAAGLKKGNVVIVGCSTSETLGMEIGNYSVPEVGQAIFDGIYGVLSPLGIYLAGQCCEHLNRAVVVSREAFPSLDEVNCVPMPKAGGSFATACYSSLPDAAVYEEIKADAGMDIGGTLIGMHLKKVAVPLRLKANKIGEANVIFAKTRPKYIGGERTSYNEELKNGYKK